MRSLILIVALAALSVGNNAAVIQDANAIQSTQDILKDEVIQNEIDVQNENDTQDDEGFQDEISDVIDFSYYNSTDILLFNKTYTVSRPRLVHFRDVTARITRIRASHVGSDQNARVRIIAGGVGQNFVTVRLQAARERTIRLEIWGRKIANLVGSYAAIVRDANAIQSTQDVIQEYMIQNEIDVQDETEAQDEEDWQDDVSNVINFGYYNASDIILFNKTDTMSRPRLVHFRNVTIRITRIRASHVGSGQNTRVRSIAGGVGQNFVTLRIQAARGRSIRLEIWGHEIANSVDNYVDVVNGRRAIQLNPDKLTESKVIENEIDVQDETEAQDEEDLQDDVSDVIDFSYYNASDIILFNKTYAVSRPRLVHFRNATVRITRIRASHVGSGQNTRVRIIAGGVGQNFVTLRIQAARGRSIRLEIWGHEIANSVDNYVDVVNGGRAIQLNSGEIIENEVIENEIDIQDETVSQDEEVLHDEISNEFSFNNATDILLFNKTFRLSGTKVVRFRNTTTRITRIRASHVGSGQNARVRIIAGGVGQKFVVAQLQAARGRSIRLEIWGHEIANSVDNYVDVVNGGRAIQLNPDKITESEVIENEIDVQDETVSEDEEVLLDEISDEFSSNNATDILLFNKTFRLSGPKLVHFRNATARITRVRASLVGSDQDARVRIIAGGVGQNFVTVRLQVSRGKSVRLEIWGSTIAKSNSIEEADYKR